MAVYAAVAVVWGYYFRCRGFQAIVRLDDDEIVVEGVGSEELYSCGDAGWNVRLATLGERSALLLPVETASGESSEAASVWQAYVAERGALRRVGYVPRYGPTKGAGLDSKRYTLGDGGYLERASTP